MSEAEQIFERIRRALAVRSVRSSHAPKERRTDSASALPGRSFDAVLPAVGTTFEDELALFQQNAADLRAGFVLGESQDEIHTALRELQQKEGWQRIASHAGQLTDPACATLGLPVLATDQPYDANELERCDAGVTECDLLVAQTGSVVVTTCSAGGRALSVLPPHHVVLARRNQLVPGLPEAFAQLRKKYGAAYPSMISFITGPSRTGDIERILVLGAHGPRRLTIFCY